MTATEHVITAIVQKEVEGQQKDMWCSWEGKNFQIIKGVAVAILEGGLQVHFKGENKGTVVQQRSNPGPTTPETYQCPFSREFHTEEKLLAVNSKLGWRQ